MDCNRLVTQLPSRSQWGEIEGDWKKGKNFSGESCWGLSQYSISLTHGRGFQSPSQTGCCLFLKVGRTEKTNAWYTLEKGQAKDSSTRTVSSAAERSPPAWNWTKAPGSCGSVLSTSRAILRRVSHGSWEPQGSNRNYELMTPESPW